MGYAATDIVFFGVFLNPEESSKVYPLLQAALCKAKGLINLNKQEL